EEVRRPLPPKAVLVQSMGPCQLPRVYQDSWRWPAAVLEKTSWGEPSGVTVALGAEASLPRVVESEGPCQPPAAYQASPRWPSVPRQKTSWEPSVVVTTAGAEARMPGPPREPLVMSTGPCQAARAYQASKRWPPGPSQKTSCWEPSLATATAGVEVSVPSWEKPTGPCHDPRVYQASASWLVVVSFQNTICWEPSGVT